MIFFQGHQDLYYSGSYHVMRLMDVESELKNLKPDAKVAVICACTPLGKPDEKWRPHEKIFYHC
jgi:hypothetical protein